MDSREFFGRYAEDYARSSSHSSDADLEDLIGMLDPQNNMVAVDLATGTGFTAMGLATKVERVIAIDQTPEMLDQARKLSKERGLVNIEFVLSDIEDLPIEDESIDIVTSRRAPHHFRDKRRFLSEVRRVLKKGGKFGLSDMIVSGSDRDDLFNSLEKTRDPSHVAAETMDGWRNLIEAAGMEITGIVEYSRRVEFQSWLSPVPLDSKEGRDCIKLIHDSSMEWQKLIGYRAQDNSFLKSRAVIVARKPLR